MLRFLPLCSLPAKRRLVASSWLALVPVFTPCSCTSDPNSGNNSSNDDDDDDTGDTGTADDDDDDDDDSDDDDDDDDSDDDDDDDDSDDDDDDDDDDDSDAAASVTIEPSSIIHNPAPDLAGSGTFSVENGGEITLLVEVTGCPAGMHGFHIHRGTECGEDGSDALDHWDPLDAGVHGQVGEDEPHHAGDAGMIECDDEGNGEFTITTDEWNLDEGDMLNPVGQAVILHGLDATQRIACGVISASDDEASFELTATTLTANPAADLGGEAMFTTEDNGDVTIDVALTGCPEGDHGFHIHAGTECGEDGSEAMGHWDPLEAGVHGQVGDDAPHHAGDVGMVSCDAEGNGTLTLTTDEWTLVGGELTNPVGQAVIVHGVDPANRVGCGVITTN